MLSASSSVGILLLINDGILGLNESIFLSLIGIGDTKFVELLGDKMGLQIRFWERDENFDS